MQETLQLTDNSKTKFLSNHKNTFGLSFGLPESGGTCPGATTGRGGCMEIIKTASGTERRTCYMDKIARIYKAVGNVLVKNTETLKGKTEDEIYLLLYGTVIMWWLKKGKDAPYFRLHYSGDFFSLDYARAWARIIKKFDDVKFWVYTRSFTKDLNVIPILADCKNLALYISCDPVNKAEALQVYDMYKDHNNIGLAYMGNDTPEGMPRLVKCPEITGKVTNDKDAGACSKCKLCFTYNDNIKLRPIHFGIH